MTVSLLPGVRPEGVIDALLDIVNRATVARSAREPFGAFNDYLRWSNEAVRQLSGRISNGDVGRLVLTRRHWVLQGIDPAANVTVMSLVQLEFDERIAALTDARERLVRDVARCASHPGKLVVADTNVYLQDPHLFIHTLIGLLTRGRLPSTLYIW